jgi:hypothetical protein
MADVVCKGLDCNWVHIVSMLNTFYTENTFYSKSNNTEMLYTEMSLGKEGVGYFRRLGPDVHRMQLGSAVTSAGARLPSSLSR